MSKKEFDAELINKSKKWHAKWIWPSTVGVDESNVYSYFRKRFTLDNNPEDIALFISADSIYHLFINGKSIGKGPPPAQPWFHYYDDYDVSNLLRKGTNCIAVVVFHFAEECGDADGRGRGGLLLEVKDDKKNNLVKSDETWKAKIADPWEKNTYRYGNVIAPYVESFDARREPIDWNDAEFDDRHWPSATAIGSRWCKEYFTPPAAGPWTKLVPRNIPYMASDTKLPEKITYTEENIDIQLNAKNLAPGLSMAGKEIHYTKCENPENLCKDDGVTIFQGSTEHLNLDFGSVYSPAVVIDFGKIVTAYLQIDIEGVDGGIIDIGYAESLIDGHFNNNVENGTAIADRYIMKDGKQEFTSFSWKAFRFLKLRFRKCLEPIKVNSIKAITTTYPYEERGKFSSDDETLNGIFKICKDTVRLCSNDSLMADAWREKAQWLGDISLVTMPTIQSCFGDTKLPRKTLYQAAQHQFPTGIMANVSNFNSMARYRTWTKSIPDYSLWWVGCLLGYFEYTGDQKLLHRVYPQVLRLLDTHLDYLNDEMLIENMPYWVFIDWADVEKRGICTIYNAIFYQAINCIQKLAQYKDDNYTSDLIKNISIQMKANFDKVLFDEKRGCYSDARVEGELSEKISEHGNITPIWAGLCDNNKSLDIIGKVFENKDSNLKFTEAQPFYMAVILPALADAGRFDLALELIRKRWGKRMLDIGATSVFETWHENGRWTSGEFLGLLNSRSIAWAACPADFLIRNMLGLKIIEPGCRKVQLNPQTTDFNYNVVFPTPNGDIKAECKNGEVKLSVPDSISL